MKKLPNYTLRESTRAKRMSLKILCDGKLEVVVPRGFDRSKIAGFVAENSEWIIRTRHRMRRQRLAHENAAPVSLPDSVQLVATGEIWKVRYRLEEGREKVSLEATDGILMMQGPKDSESIFREVLLMWLKDRGRQLLPRMLAEIAAECGFRHDSYKRVTVRTQKTKWGSFSSSGTISLNALLLLLPNDVVRYVLVHELCQTVHPNHSGEFWKVVQRHVAGAMELRSKLRRSEVLPEWVYAEKVALP
ncbi:MAG: YgjP-like metallopeptidase domain-containing protein [Planctomycetota bacterium]|nr:YgjP-like metallopeptidase domain-containing protein [Planctomycetota bacterium]